MNAQNAKEFLPLVQAMAYGKKIQVECGGEWRDESNPYFDLPPERYRVKPEPQRLWVVRRKDTISRCCYFDALDGAKAFLDAMGNLDDYEIVEFEEVAK